jgi:hypothetical protein
MENEEFVFENTDDQDLKTIIEAVQEITSSLDEIFELQGDIKRKKSEMKDDGIDMSIVNKAMMLIKREISEDGDEKIEEAMKLKETLMEDPIIRAHMLKIYTKEKKIR